MFSARRTAKFAELLIKFAGCALTDSSLKRINASEIAHQISSPTPLKKNVCPVTLTAKLVRVRRNVQSARMDTLSTVHRSALPAQQI